MSEGDGQVGPSAYELEVDRSEFLDALISIAAFKRRSGTARLKMAFDGGELQLSMPSVDISFAARGTWPSAVWVEARIVWALAAVPPNTNPIHIKFANGRVRIGSTVAVATSHK